MEFEMRVKFLVSWVEIKSALAELNSGVVIDLT
jgi:hypothetical protein